MRRTLTRLLLVLLTVAGGLLLVLVAIGMFGRVTGEEFAPDTFERRTYVYYELPIFRIQVSSVTREKRQGFEQELINKNYILPTRPPKRWDLVHSSRMGGRWRQGDARILCLYLDALSDQTLYWLEWTKGHPQLAAILWPEIAKLARQELYLLTPELFQVAADATDPKRLAHQLNQVLARRFEELADMEMQLKNFQTARRFYAQALSYEPARATSRAGHARANQAVGDRVGHEGAPPATSEWEAEESANDRFGP
ncbi:MAG: hypothetical protein ACYC6N_00320 [Pirellulaceae bacterium]